MQLSYSPLGKASDVKDSPVKVLSFIKLRFIYEVTRMLKVIKEKDLKKQKPYHNSKTTLTWLF